MGTEKSEIDEHLSAFVTLTRATAKAFPELPSISEWATLLQGLAIADADGRISIKAWSARTGIRIHTLERFAKFFASVGLLNADELNASSVRLESSTPQRLLTAFRSSFEQ